MRFPDLWTNQQLKENKNKIKLVVFKNGGKQALELKHTNRKTAISSDSLCYAFAIAKAKASLSSPHFNDIPFYLCPDCTFQ